MNLNDLRPSLVTVWPGSLLPQSHRCASPAVMCLAHGQPWNTATPRRLTAHHNRDGLARARWPVWLRLVAQRAVLPTAQVAPGERV